jgi:hypothetical protein
MRQLRAPAPTALHVERLHSLVEGQAVTAQEANILAGAIQRLAEELQEQQGCTDREGSLRAAGLLDALTSEAERLSALTDRLADELATLSDPERWSGEQKEVA